MIEPDRLKALRGAIGRFAHALEAGDTAALESLLSLGYRHTDKSGKLWSRNNWLAQVRPAPRPSTAIDFGSWSAILRGELGIVTGIKHLWITGAPEDEQDRPTAFTHLWIWQDGRWLRELFQETVIVHLDAI